MQVTIRTDYIEKGYLYSPICLIPSNNPRRTYINVDGIKFLKALVVTTEDVHPLSDFGLAICQFLAQENILQEKKTRFGLKFSFVSDEGVVAVQELIKEIECKLEQAKNQFAGNTQC